MNEHDLREIGKFLTACKAFERGHPFASLLFIAVKHGDVFEIYRAQLLLGWYPINLEHQHFSSDRVRAGIYRLEEIANSLPEFIDLLLSGKLPTPNGELIFESERNDSFSSHFFALHPDGFRHQRRQMRLRIQGRHFRENIDSEEFAWELKGSSPPFDSVGDLCKMIGLGNFRERQSEVEIIALCPVEISQESNVSGTNATIVLYVPKSLRVENAAVNFLVQEKRDVIRRGTLTPEHFCWEQTDDSHKGTAKLTVPAASMIHCFAMISGTVHHHFWVLDLDRTQNYLRAAYESFDEKLVTLRSMIENAFDRQRNSEEFEAGIAHLMWILGFSVLHLGSSSKTKEAADVIASTPFGHLAILEISVGAPHRDKISRLVGRAEKMRKSLDDSGHQMLRTLKIFVTAKTEAEMTVNRKDLVKENILLLTRASFEAAILRTVFYPNAEKIFEEAEAILASAKSRIDDRIVES